MEVKNQENYGGKGSGAVWTVSGVILVPGRIETCLGSGTGSTEDVCEVEISLEGPSHTLSSLKTSPGF